MTEDPCRICGKESEIGVHSRDSSRYYCEEHWNMIKARKLKEPEDEKQDI